VTVLRSSRQPKYCAFASYSRTTFEARRHASFFNPLTWINTKLTTDQRPKESDEEVEASKKQAAEEGNLSVFDEAPPVEADESSSHPGPTSPSFPQTAAIPRRPKAESHKFSTSNFKISHRKLNMLGRQISGKPIDYAILQMQFSEKRASERVKKMLSLAKDHAVRYKHLDKAKLVVAEAWVTKGPTPPARLEPRGRGHHGRRQHPNSRIHVVLKEGKTVEEQRARERARKLNRIVSANATREDKPIRNPGAMWAW